jgi:hypothetical protein
MSLEDQVGSLTQAINKLTDMIGSKAAEAALSASADVGNTTAASAPAEKPKASRAKAAPKAEAKAAPKADEFDELDELNSDTPADDGLGLDDDLGLDDEPEVKAVSKDDLKKAFVELSKKKGGREAVADILKKLKSTSFTDLKEEKFAEAYALVQKELA